MTYSNDDFNAVEVDVTKGIDGLNNIADLEEGFSLDSRNVDLSSPGFIQKRAGYHLHGCKLPVRVKSTVLTYNAGTLEYDSVSCQLDFIPQYERTLQIWLNDNTTNSAYGDARFRQFDNTAETVFVRIKDYTTNPNTNTITTDTILEIQNAGVVFYCQPLAVFDNNTFILPRSVFTGIGGINSGAGAAKELVSRFGVGPAFNSIMEDEMTSLITLAGTGVELVVTDSALAKIKLGAIVRFDSGLYNTSASSDQMTGHVSAIVGNTLSITLNAAWFGITARDLYWVRMYFCNGTTFYYHSQSTKFFSFNSHPTVAKKLLSCNRLSIATDCDALGTTSTGTLTQLGFLYGTDISVAAISLLGYYNDIDIERNRLICGYDGNVFVDTAPNTRAYKTKSTAVIANQAFTVVAGFFNITVTDSSVYRAGDTLYLEYSNATTWDTVSFELLCDSIVNATTIKVSAVDTTPTSCPINSKLRFKRNSVSVIFQKESYDAVPLVFAGATFQTLGLGNNYTTHRITKATYLTTGSEHQLETDNAVEWYSDSFIYLGSNFLPVERVDSTILDQYEPVLSSYSPNTAIDLSNALIDRTMYIAAQKDGMWKYNGSQLINMCLPPPPAPLLVNVPGSSGSLSIVEDSDGNRVGRFYNIVCTYSYFEFSNGVLREIESGITPYRTGAIQAAPALDGTFNSQLVEVQVKSIPHGLGLPADNILINIYRSVDGTLDGINADGQFLYRESSTPNNPDYPYVIAYAGVLTGALLSANGKPLYASVSEDSSNEFTRNTRLPPLANHIINFQNRIIAMNGREHPYFNLVANQVFDSVGDFAAAGSLVFKAPNVDIGDYIFSLCPFGAATVSGSASYGTGITRYQVFTTETYPITNVLYSDTSYSLQLEYKALGEVVAADKLLLKAVARDNKDVEYDGFQFDRQVFTVSVAGSGAPPTPNQILAEKKWTDLRYVLTTLPTEYWVFKYYEGSGVAAGAAGVAGTVKVNILNTGIEMIDTTEAASWYDNAYVVIKGIGTLCQMRDKNDIDNKVYDLDYDVVFFCQARATATDYDLTPCKITGLTTAGLPDTIVMQFSVDVPVINITNTSDVGTPHDAIQIYRAFTGAVSTYEVMPVAIPNVQATLTIPAGQPDLALVGGLDMVTVEDIPIATSPSKVPNELGIEFNKTLPVSLYTYGGAGVSTLRVDIEPPLAVFANFNNAVTGRLITSKNIIIASTYLEIDYPSAAQITLDILAAGQWVFMISKSTDGLKHSLQISGWYQLVAMKTGGAWSTTSIAAGVNLQGLRIAMDGTKLDPTLFIGVDIKIIAGRNLGGALGLNNYIPVPVPVSLTDDATGSMFGPLDGQTPFERIIKRLGTAVSTVMASQGFAYWGDDPGNIDEEFPVNGLKFVSHKWPNNKYTYARSPFVDFFNENLYTISWYLASGFYEITANSGKTVSDLTVQTDELLEERYPNRIWWTTPDEISFRDLSFDDITSEDGEEIIGGIPFEEFFLVVKENQMFKIKIESTGLVKDRVQAKVGAVSKKNIIPTNQGAVFLSKTGFYFTDGSSVRKIVRLNRVFKDYVKRNESLFPFTSGVFDPTNYMLRLGAPVADSIDGVWSINNRHLNLNFSSLGEPEGGVTGGGWSLNTDIPANVWLHIDESTYFGANASAVYRMRSEISSTLYRDDESAILMRIDTRFLDFGSPDTQKFVREAVLQLDTKYDNSIDISTTWDFRKSYHEIGSFTLDQSALAIENIGNRYAASEKYIESRRQTVDPMRSTQIGFRLENSSIDQNGGIHALWMHVTKIGPKQIRQR